jgi:hypothetical protein
MVSEFKFVEPRLARREIVARRGAQARVTWPPVHPGASDAQLGSALADDRGCGRLIERRRQSPVELTNRPTARIETLDPQLNAFFLPTPDYWAQLGNGGWGWDDIQPFFIILWLAADWMDPLIDTDGGLALQVMPGRCCVFGDGFARRRR